MSDENNVVKLFPDKEEGRVSRSKMGRHKHSSLEMLIMSVASYCGKDRAEIEAELCIALGVARWEDSEMHEAQDWLKNKLVSRPT
jgi:hypothetical protein